MNQKSLLAFADTVVSGNLPLDAYADLGIVADLLEHLGHRCSGRCPNQAFTLEGLVCVIPRRELPTSVVLVLFDLNQRPEPLVEIIRMLRAVNRCVRGDRIRVLAADGGS